MHSEPAQPNDTLHIREIAAEIGWDYSIARRFLVRQDVRDFLRASMDQEKKPVYPIASLAMITVMARYQHLGVVTSETARPWLDTVKRILDGHECVWTGDPAYKAARQVWELTQSDSVAKIQM